jgi:hypothetical protein
MTGQRFDGCFETFCRHGTEVIGNKERGSVGHLAIMPEGV